MTAESILEALKQAIVIGRHTQAAEAARQGLETGLSGRDLLLGALLPALDQVGGLFRGGEYFLPDVLMCVRAYKSAYGLVEPLLRKGDYPVRGLVMAGTVQGDIHEIGKNIFLALLQGNGFQVFDLGVDVPARTFLEKAREHRPDIIGLSSLLTSTMTSMKETIDLFVAEGIRDEVKFLVGGAPLSQAFADEIGADGYGRDAQAGVDLAKAFVSRSS